MVNKIVLFNLYLKAAKKNPHTFEERPQIYTNDKQSVELQFNALDTSSVELGGASATILLFMGNGSFFQKTDVVRQNNTFTYVMKSNETKHSGIAKVQLVVEMDGVEIASPLYEIRVIGGLETKPIQEVEIQDWTTLTAEAKAFVEQIEGFTLEQFVENKMGEELANLEVNYATRLTGLETNDANLTAQLEETKKRVYTKETKVKRPLVSFYLDDGYETDYTVVFPKSSSLGIPVTICLHNNSYLASKNETPTQMRNELLNAGWEIHGHTVKDQNLTLLSYEEQYETMRDNKEYLEDLIGEPIEGFCYPRGQTNADTLKAARQLFKNGLSSVPAINTSPIDTYFVKRYLTDTNLPRMKEAVDKIKADGEGWIILYAHTNLWGANPTLKDNYFEMIDYVLAKGVETVSVKEAMEVYENTLDIGDVEYSEDYFKIGADGSVNSSSIPIVTGDNEPDISSKKGTDFASGRITIDNFLLGKNSDIPFDNGVGTLFTNRLMENPKYVGTRALQRFEGVNGSVVERYWNTPMEWSKWVSQGKLNAVKTDDYSENFPVTDFRWQFVTVNEFLSGEAPNFPLNGIGTLVTNRIGDNTSTHFQLFYPYQRPDLFYRRTWNGNSWSEFERFSAPTTFRETYDFGTVPAKGTENTAFTVPGVRYGDATNVTFLSGLANGVVPFAYSGGNNTVVVRLINVTDSPVTVGSRPIRIVAIRG